MPRKANINPAEKDWRRHAADLRTKAESLVSDSEREALLNQAKQLEAAARVKEWLESPGEMPPAEATNMLKKRGRAGVNFRIDQKPGSTGRKRQRP